MLTQLASLHQTVSCTYELNSGAVAIIFISVIVSAWLKKVFHQLYQDDILIFVMRRLEQSRVYATSQQGQSLQLQYLWTGFFRFSVNLQDLKFYVTIQVLK